MATRLKNEAFMIKDEKTSELRPDSADRICPICGGAKSAHSKTCIYCETKMVMDKNIGYLNGQKVYV